MVEPGPPCSHVQRSKKFAFLPLWRFPARSKGTQGKDTLLFIFYLSVLLETFTMSCHFLVINIFNFIIFCNKKVARMGQWKGMCVCARKT